MRSELPNKCGDQWESTGSRRCNPGFIHRLLSAAERAAARCSMLELLHPPTCNWPALHACRGIAAPAHDLAASKHRPGCLRHCTLAAPITRPADSGSVLHPLHTSQHVSWVLARAEGPHFLEVFFFLLPAAALACDASLAACSFSTCGTHRGGEQGRQMSEDSREEVATGRGAAGTRDSGHCCRGGQDAGRGSRRQCPAPQGCTLPAAARSLLPVLPTGGCVCVGRAVSPDSAECCRCCPAWAVWLPLVPPTARLAALLQLPAPGAAAADKAA